MDSPIALTIAGLQRRLGDAEERFRRCDLIQNADEQARQRQECQRAIDAIKLQIAEARKL